MTDWELRILSCTSDQPVIGNPVKITDECENNPVMPKERIEELSQIRVDGYMQFLEHKNSKIYSDKSPIIEVKISSFDNRTSAMSISDKFPIVNHYFAAVDC